MQLGYLGAGLAQAVGRVAGHGDNNELRIAVQQEQAFSKVVRCGKKTWYHRF
jgi:hypothetical protein